MVNALASSWLILSVAIIFEVLGTTCLKLSDGFTRLTPTILIFVFYGIGFYFMTLTMKRLDLGLVYAVWSGAGTALVAILGVYLFGDVMNYTRAFFLLMIVIGVIGLNVSSTL